MKSRQTQPLVRDHPAPHGVLQGLSFEQDRARHDLQARRGRREKLASSRWSQPVAESHSRLKFTDGSEVVRSQAQAAA
jgi:hypothetical protein